MTKVHVAHTADLDRSTLIAARALLDEAFAGDFSDQDWEHALGGMHALLWEGGELAGHGSVVQRRLLYRGRALRTGYVEGVGVRPGFRGRGYGAAVMDALERLVRGGYDLGALTSSEQALRFYPARGWRLWQGPSFALTPAGIRRTEDDDGAIYVLEGTIPLDLSAELICDWRDGAVW